MQKTLPGIPSREVRLLKAGLLILAAFLLLAGALSIPFFFESPSIRYKFGFDKTLLRAGKLLGTGAATLLFFQLLLGGRLNFFDRVFTLPRVWAFHRLNGYLIALLALLHPVFILWPEDFTLPPLRLEYWPQAAGLLLLVLICLQVASSRWRGALHIAFHRWRQYHRYIGGSIILLLVLHILFVSETYEAGLPPRYVLLATAGLFVLVFMGARIKTWRTAKLRCVVTAVTPENSRVTTLEVDTGKRGARHYLPGQFAFISIAADRISGEEHPFTISSSPTQPDRLAFTIKDSGNWTAAIKHVRKGDAIHVNGPFGLFSHPVCAPRQPLVLIAGGIGVTPMLSMLRYMHATGDNRRTLLLWSNRRVEDLICRDELENMARDLTGLHMVHTFTAERIEGAGYGRLDQSKLQALLDGVDRSAAAFICGPPRMMAQISRDMRSLGFKRRSIYTERFSL